MGASYSTAVLRKTLYKLALQAAFLSAAGRSHGKQAVSRNRVASPKSDGGGGGGGVCALVALVERDDRVEVPAHAPCEKGSEAPMPCPGWRAVPTEPLVTPGGWRAVPPELLAAPEDEALAPGSSIAGSGAGSPILQKAPGRGILSAALGALAMSKCESNALLSLRENGRGRATNTLWHGIL